MRDFENILKWVIAMTLIAIICVALIGCASFRKTCTMEEWLVTSDCP